MQSHQAGKKERFQVLLGALVDNEGQPSHKLSPVMLRQFIHKSFSVRSEYLVGKCARPWSLLSAVPSVNLWLEKKNQSRQRNVRARTRWLRGTSELPKSSEDSSFKCSLVCYFIWGEGVFFILIFIVVKKQHKIIFSIQDLF